MSCWFSQQWIVFAGWCILVVFRSESSTSHRCTIRHCGTSSQSDFLGEEKNYPKFVEVSSNLVFSLIQIIKSLFGTWVKFFHERADFDLVLRGGRGSHVVQLPPDSSPTWYRSEATRAILGKLWKYTWNESLIALGPIRLHIRSSTKKRMRVCGTSRWRLVLFWMNASGGFMYSVKYWLLTAQQVSRKQHRT